MAIVYPLSHPATPGFRTSRFTAAAAVAVASSPFTFQQQVYEYPGQIWRAELTLPPMRRDSAEAWLAFLLALNGRRGTFLLGDPDGRTPRGAAIGSPVVDGAGQTGQVLVTAGWAPGVAGILRAGDYIQLGSLAASRLHKVLADVDSDGAGRATLDIWPRLRESPADGTALTVSECKGVFRLASNEVSWDADQASIYGISFSAVEVI